MHRGTKRAGAIVAILSPTNCAVGVPHMGDIGTSQDQRILSEERLVSHIQCELHLAFERVHDDVAYSHGAVGPTDPVVNSIA